MRPCTNRWKQPQVLRFWSLRRASTTPTLAGRTRQQGIRNPGSWSVIDNFLLCEIEETTRTSDLLDFVLTWIVKVKVSLGGRDHEMVEFKILRAGKGGKLGSKPRTSAEQTFPSSKICLEESYEVRSWREESLRKVI